MGNQQKRHKTSRSNKKLLKPGRYLTRTNVAIGGITALLAGLGLLYMSRPTETPVQKAEEAEEEKARTSGEWESEVAKRAENEEAEQKIEEAKRRWVAASRGEDEEEAAKKAEDEKIARKEVARKVTEEEEAPEEAAAFLAAFSSGDAAETPEQKAEKEAEAQQDLHDIKEFAALIGVSTKTLLYAFTRAKYNILFAFLRIIKMLRKAIMEAGAKGNWDDKWEPDATLLEDKRHCVDKPLAEAALTLSNGDTDKAAEILSKISKTAKVIRGIIEDRDQRQSELEAELWQDSKDIKKLPEGSRERFDLVTNYNKRMKELQDDTGYTDALDELYREQQK